MSLTLQHFGATAQRIREAPRPVIVASNVLTDITEVGRQVQRETGFPYVVGGIEHAMTSIGAAVRWSRALREATGTASAEKRVPPVVAEETTGVWAEHRASRLDCLRDCSSASSPARPWGCWCCAEALWD